MARQRPFPNSHARIALLILAAVAILMAKHMVADFYLQTAYQYMNKGTLRTSRRAHPCGHPCRAHALVYLVLAPASLLLALGITVGEFLVHYHTDWLKSRSIAAKAGR